jgi:hypothetical protein
VLGVLGTLCYLGLAYDRSAPYAAAATAGAAVLLGAVGWLRWQALPARTRAATLRLPRTEPRARALALLAGAGVLALVAVVPAAMLGELTAARAAATASVAATLAAAVVARR